MTLDVARRTRTLRRYRFMFKAALVEVAVSLLMLAAGVVVALNGAGTEFIGWSLIVFIIAFIGAYKILNSTVRLLEHEAAERGWQNLA